MIALLNEFLLAAGASLAASIVLKATVVAALGLFGAWLLRGRRAALRHAVLAAALGVLLVLPALAILAPAIRIAIETPSNALAPTVFSGATSPSGNVALPTGAPLVSAHSFPLSAVLLSVWFCGTALFLMPVAIGLWQVGRIRRTAVSWDRGQSDAGAVARERGIGRGVDVILHETPQGPMTCGIFRPAIMFPRDAESWSGEELNRALIHELEHVRRCDWATGCIARAVCATYWFHPLVWMAWRRLALEAERACDDAVLGRSEAAAYAGQLVGLAERLHSAASAPLIAMASRADLGARVRAILDSRQPRGRAGLRAVALASVAALALALTFSPLRIAAAPQSSGDAFTVAPPPRFVAGTSLVLETVVVTDQNNKSVENLTAGDFEITENGISQRVALFEFQAGYYVIGYYTLNDAMDGRYRPISVTCARPGAKLEFRSGYYAARRLPSAGAAPSGGAPSNQASPAIFTYPEVIHKVEAAYSDGARKAKFQGTCILLVDVGADGKVADAKVQKNLGLGLDEQALGAVKSWTFKPGTQNGRPIAMWAEVEFTFRLL